MTDRIKATKDHWKTEDEPADLVEVSIQLEYTAEEYSTMILGHIPHEMEQRWFIYSENDWIYFHRSWTGRFYGKVRFVKTEKGYKTAEAWAIPIENPHKRSMDNDRLFEMLLAGLTIKRD